MVEDFFKERGGEVSSKFETAMELEKVCEERLSKKVSTLTLISIPGFSIKK